MGVFARLKFEPVGVHPVEDRPLNLIEQINQTFTYIASLHGARWILDRHPRSAPLHLNLGAIKGFDIESDDRSVVAETFAAVDPRNNDKLAKDIRRVREADREYGYVFYLCPGQETRTPLDEEGVTVVQLPWSGELADTGLQADGPAARR
jgi:hypothetical protein